VPGHPLGQKMSGVGYRAKNLFAKPKFFSAGGHPPPLANFWLRP